MKFVLDTHLHTLSSGHAYSTLAEYVQAAKQLGLELIAQTDHGPAMPGGPHAFHIGNQRVLPDYMDGVRVLKGVEANIVDLDGRLDLEERYLRPLEIVIASLHDVVIHPGTRSENTQAILNAMKNPYVDVIAHPGNPAFPIDIDAFVQAACEYDVLVEINNSSFGGSRRGSRGNCVQIAQKAMEYGAKVIVGSDAHICYDLGRFDDVEEVFEELDMPAHLVMNASAEGLVDHLRRRGKKVSY